jgi:DNA-binding response OmpR family regulator
MKKKILLIEDDQIFANVYRNKLLLEGYDVEIAHDGEDGLEKVRSYLPDAVVLDLMLPKLPGVDIIRKIRLEPDLQQLPLVVFTNTYLTSMVQEAWKAGATKCLAKADCTPRQVLGAIRSVLVRENTPPPPAPPPPAQSATAPVSEPEPDPVEEPPAINLDDEFQVGLRESFVESLPLVLGGLRSLLQALVKAENDTARLQQINHLYRRVRGLTSNASLVGMFHITQMSDALEALLKELHEKPKTVNASTLRTVASAIDFLGILFERNGTPAGDPVPDANVLVVDDDAIARRAIGYSLEKARLKSVAVEDPLQALQLLPETRFDLIFLDVDMPTMNGYELCSKVRTLPAYKKTPVVFVTSLNDFESRVNSSMSGGNDFIAKPFLFIELAVKALVYVVGGRLATSRN